jgi:endonuclease YncB( thermonuclease family)
VTLVREGAAGVWFFDGARGRHAGELLRAAERARAQEKGLWGACPLARFDPPASLATGPAAQ